MVMIYSEDTTINPFIKNNGLFNIWLNGEYIGLGYLVNSVFTEINTKREFKISKEDDVRAAKVPDNYED